MSARPPRRPSAPSLAGSCCAKRAAMRPRRAWPASRETSGAAASAARRVEHRPAVRRSRAERLRRCRSPALLGRRRPAPPSRAARSPSSASTSIGLVRKPLKPAASSSASKPFIALAVSAMIGSVQPRRRSVAGRGLAVHHRHLHVHQHQVEASAATRSSATWPFSASLDLQPDFLEQHAHQLAVLVAVVDDQHVRRREDPAHRPATAQRRRSSLPAAPPARASRRRQVAGRQRHT